ncbi:MAG: nitroreductase family deazaflavin-dependent oxidoreductase [Actinomycetia bacterium]|nr:nitroreductase family deazaflavin-dependent oxidoreductase [Actinomycetes bacterium]
MSRHARLLKAAARTTPVRWVMSKVLTPLDMKLRGTRFAPSTMGLDLPLCFVTTTGAKSGESRTVPLLFVSLEHGVIAVVASNFGSNHHPGWAYNLEAHPRATVEIDDERTVVVATRADDDETQSLWPLLDDVWPGYETYRSITQRDIKIFLLTPATD